MISVIILVILIIIIFVVGFYLIKKGMNDRQSGNPDIYKKGETMLIIGVVVLIVAVILVLPAGAMF
jgi:UDP-N-acetylmuramyl pentapeptide phosphotransferase/UDP-N-acetylglucosamine-1-phosphate transferase